MACSGVLDEAVSPRNGCLRFGSEGGEMKGSVSAGYGRTLELQCSGQIVAFGGARGGSGFV